MRSGAAAECGQFLSASAVVCKGRLQQLALSAGGSLNFAEEGACVFPVHCLSREAGATGKRPLLEAFASMIQQQTQLQKQTDSTKEATTTQQRTIGLVGVPAPVLHASFA